MCEVVESAMNARQLVSAAVANMFVHKNSLKILTYLPKKKQDRHNIHTTKYLAGGSDSTDCEAQLPEEATYFMAMDSAVLAALSWFRSWRKLAAFVDVLVES